MTADEAIKQFEERLQIPDYKTQIPEYYEAMELAVEALEKQVPKKPPYDEYHRAGYRCPNCNNTNPWGYNYCKHCGQRLDWRE